MRTPVLSPHLLTGLLKPKLDGRVVVLFPLEAEDLPLPVTLLKLLFDLPLSLGVQTQETRAQRLVQAQEDVPVVVDEEEVVGIVTGAQLLSWRVGKKELGFAGAPGYTVVLFGASFVELDVLLFFFFLLSVRQSTSLREEHIRDEVVHYLLDLVLVFFLDAGLSLDMVDNQGSGVLLDLPVLIGEGEVRAARRCPAFLRGLLLALQKQPSDGHLLWHLIVQYFWLVKNLKSHCTRNTQMKN